MGWNISDIHKFIDAVLIRKERNAFITEAEKDTALDRGQIYFFEEMFRDFGKTQAIHDALTPFKTPVNFNTTHTPNGTITLKDDYMHYLGGYVTVYDNVNGAIRLPLQFINEDELVFAMQSQVRKPSLLRPFAYNNNSTIQLFPETPMSGAYSYLRRPAIPKYAFVQTGRTITYDPANSVQLEWNEAYLSNIIHKALVYLGVELNENDLVQIGMIKDQQQKQQ